MPSKLEDEVRAAFDRAISALSTKNDNRDASSPDDLLAAVRTLVRNLKSAGKPPENVVVTVKELCGLSRLTIASDTDSSLDLPQSRKISDMVVKAAIEEYYLGIQLTGRGSGQGYSSELEDATTA